MTTKEIKKIYKEYFTNCGLGKNDFVDFLRDVYESSVAESVSFAVSNFPNKYRWEILIRDRKILPFITVALKYRDWKEFKSYFFKKLKGYL